MILATVVGLAVVDAVNPATIAAVALILLSPFRRPITTALWFVVGVYATVFVAGTLLAAGAGSFGAQMEGGLLVVRRVALLIAAGVLVVQGLRRLRPSVAPPLTFPAWLTPRRAAILGLATTAVDLPNAFPYVIAIERMLEAGIAFGATVALIALYSAIYCVPCLVLVGLWRVRGNVVRERLGPYIERFRAGGPRPASWRAATAFLAAGLTVAGISLLL